MDIIEVFFKKLENDSFVENKYDSYEYYNKILKDFKKEEMRFKNLILELLRYNFYFDEDNIYFHTLDNFKNKIEILKNSKSYYSKENKHLFYEVGSILNKKLPLEIVIMILKYLKITDLKNFN